MAYIGVARDDLQQLSIGPVGAGAVSSVIVAMGRVSQSITPASVAAATAVEQTFTVPGLRVGDFVDVTPPGLTVGVAPVTSRVSAANTIAITWLNPTAGALVPAAGVYQIQVMR